MSTFWYQGSVYMLSGLDKKDTSFVGRTANTHVLYLQLF